MTQRILILPLLLCAPACGGGTGDALIGTRVDGVEVYCEQVGEEEYECKPVEETPGEEPSEEPGEEPGGSPDGAPGDEGAECASDSSGGPALVLWPPNHKMHTITLEDCAGLLDECTTALEAADQGTIVALTSDEAVEVGKGGDGRTPDGDMAIVDGHTVELRAERQGGGDGRVYRIEFALDGASHFCEVHVPHNQGPTAGALDSGTVETIAAQ